MPILLLFPILLMTKGSLPSARAQASHAGSPPGRLQPDTLKTTRGPQNTHTGMARTQNRRCVFGSILQKKGVKTERELKACLGSPAFLQEDTVLHF